MAGLYGKKRFGVRNARPVMPADASGELPHYSENLLCRHKNKPIPQRAASTAS